MQALELLPPPPRGILPPPDAFLREAIQPDQIHFIAKTFFIHDDSVRRWRRPVASLEELYRQGPRGTGAASPLQRCCDLTRAIASYDIKAAGRVSMYPSFYFQALVEQSGEGFADEHACAAANMKLLDEANDAIKFMSLQGCCLETLREQIELRDIAAQMISRTFATMLRRAAE
ncbi:MAG: hypothetical protein AUG51_09410 [Acidobacteria bacterium 13_1_20CM_3_53_8]|nr:MAG: hypothetical protein AUG51_09410 [Acidobacteria bacterium 13_1_20CM_3_53_8]